MLLSFTVANFRSFREEQTLSMVAWKSLTDHPDHGVAVPGTDLRVLPIAVFYGANGAGKSNLVKALKFAVGLIKEGVAPKAPVPVQPFRLGGTEGQPSKFELRFLSGDKVFGYGFELVAEEVRAEWLDLYEGETAHPLFERQAEEAGPRLEISDRLRADSEKVAALGKVGVRRNQLFLSTVLESVESEDQGRFIQGVIIWINLMHSVEADDHYEDFAAFIALRPEARQFVAEYLRDSDTGVSGLKTRALPLGRRLGEDIRDSALARLKAGERQVRIPMGDGENLYVGLNENQELAEFEVETLHQTPHGEVSMAFKDQSDGTKRLAELLPLVRMTNHIFLLVIDEIDRSLHPILAQKFIESFLRLTRNETTQLIVTTHETQLLNLKLLRRDEIWFAEKDPSGATHIYPLADFPVREDAQVAEGYLQGRYGAIPFLGPLKHLVEREAEKQVG